VASVLVGARALPPWAAARPAAAAMRLDLQPGPVAPTMWVGARLMAPQLAVPMVRPLVRRGALPLVWVMALMQSAAAALPLRSVGLLAARIVAPRAPALPAAGRCPRQVRSWRLGATGEA
jgi:hypothetical protein